MKKKLLTASILIGLGGLLIMAGYAFGGTTVLPDTHFDDAVPAADEDSPLAVLNSSGITQMHCTADIGVLTILAHDKPDFAYSIRNNTKLMKAAVYCEGKTLYIETKESARKRFWGWGLWRNDFRGAKHTAITVYVPRGFDFETVSIESGAARITVGDFTVHKKFVLNGGVGELLVRNITAAAAKIQTGVGKNTFSDCVFTDMDMKTGIGENSFTGVLYGRTSVKTGIGETSLRIAGRREDYRFSLTAGIGDIYIDDKRVARIFDSEVSSDEKGGTGNYLIRVESGIGKVRIDFTGAADSGQI